MSAQSRNKQRETHADPTFLGEGGCCHNLVDLIIELYLAPSCLTSRKPLHETILCHLSGCLQVPKVRIFFLASLTTKAVSEVTSPLLMCWGFL